MSEAVTQAAIKRGYKKRGWISIKIDPCSGVEAGIPDLICFGPKGQTIFIEVKKVGEGPTPIQLYQHNRLRALGHEVIVASDVTTACEPLHRGETE